MYTDFLSCDNKLRGFLGGAAVSLIGLDTVFNGLGLSKEVHWAAAGAGLKAYCEGGMPELDMELAMCTVGGFLGGYAVSLLRRNDVPFTGPLL
eukprot:6174295-Pleurochrysis_carterae.AAC.4